MVRVAEQVAQRAGGVSLEIFLRHLDVILGTVLCGCVDKTMSRGGQRFCPHAGGCSVDAP